MSVCWGYRAILDMVWNSRETHNVSSSANISHPGSNLLGIHVWIGFGGRCAQLCRWRIEHGVVERGQSILSGKLGKWSWGLACFKLYESQSWGWSPVSLFRD